MGRVELSNRDNWQTKNGRISKKGETNFTSILKQILPSKYEVEQQVKDFNDNYSKNALPEKISSRIYDPGKETLQKSKWGWIPDNAIINTETGKKIFIELKHQKGWTNLSPRKEGRGNAHERGLKHFSPGILEAEREKSGITNNDFLPFIIVYTGQITLDPKRNREISYWFDKFQKNYFMWRTYNNKYEPYEEYDPEDLYKYLKENVLPELD